MDIRHFSDLDDLIHGRLSAVVAISDVLRNRSVKEHRLLPYDAELRSERTQRNRGDVTSIQRHVAGDRIVEPLQQLNASGLPAAALTHECHHLTRLDD